MLDFILMYLAIGGGIWLGQKIGDAIPVPKLKRCPDWVTKI